MSSKLLDHSEDLRRLWNEGYAVELSGAHLLIHNVPYVTPQKKVKRGTLITVLELNGDQTIPPSDHVAYFIGERPSKYDGSSLTMVIGTEDVNIGGFTANNTLSAKAPYADYYQKMTRYVSILMHPALEYDDTLIVKTFEVFESAEDNSVFEYLDTNTARARIYSVSEKLKGHKIAILGVGGTGSYLLDFLAKTPVAEIHLFDGDEFLQHNAFRAPGATPKQKFYEHLKKVTYYFDIYSNMHRFIVPHAYHMRADKAEELAAFDFVFICMDSGEEKKAMIEYLEQAEKSFIDTGLGVQDIDGLLKGIAKITVSTPEKRDHFRNRVSFKQAGNNLYDQNIQIAELNSLNATMAIIKWKQLVGFYHDLDKAYFSTFVLYNNEIINEDLPS